MDVIIRTAKEEDLLGLHEVMKVICDEGAALDKGAKIIRDINENKDQILIVAVDENTKEIVASLFALSFPDLCGTGRPILLVENVAVLEKYQGMGVGKKLFSYIEKWGHEKDCHYEILVSGNDRKGAHKFYESLNFIECKGFKKYNI